MSPAPFCPAFLKLNVERALLRCYNLRMAQTAKNSTHANQLSVRHFGNMSPELLHVELLKADAHGISQLLFFFRGRCEAGETLV
jgi:hypothetical protein